MDERQKEARPVYYSVKDLSEMLQVSERTVYKYVRTGLLKGVKIAGKWRFTTSDLDDFTDTLRKRAYPRFLKKQR